jgi:hypothetical protein
MQEVFFTILVVWILFRVLNSGNTGGNRSYTFTQHNYGKQQQEAKKEGDVDITYIPKSKSGKSPESGDYVDFEEIK